MEELLTYIRKIFIHLNYGEFGGMKEPTVSELVMAKAMIDFAIEELKAKGDTP